MMRCELPSGGKQRACSACTFSSERSARQHCCQLEDAEVFMGLTEHTLVFVQELSADESAPAGAGVNWEVRTSGQSDKKSGALQRIFVVPICSAFSLDAASYHDFLQESGAMGQAWDLRNELICKRLMESALPVNE